jgi:post-segregation antitoxin (ccd killing protein)
MPRMQVYLPDDLYDEVKSRGLPASELLQDAVRAAVRREQLRTETETYVADLAAEVGPPSAGERAKAEATAARVKARHASRAS